MATFLDLPADVIRQIMRAISLDIIVLSRLSRVCKRLRAVAIDERLWRDVLLARWPSADLTGTQMRRMSWRNRCRHLLAQQRSGQLASAGVKPQRRERHWRATGANTEEVGVAFYRLDREPIWAVSNLGFPVQLSQYFSDYCDRGDPAALPWGLREAGVKTRLRSGHGGAYTVVAAKVTRAEFQVIDLDQDEQMLTLLDPADGATRQLPQPESALALDIADGLAASRDVSVVVERILEEEEVILAVIDGVEFAVGYD